MSDALVKIAVLAYNLILLGATAYMVEVYNWSMWTFLLAALFFYNSQNQQGITWITEDLIT